MLMAVHRGGPQGFLRITPPTLKHFLELDMLISGLILESERPLTSDFETSSPTSILGVIHSAPR